MTREEFIQQWGDFAVQFNYYYKFTFGFIGKQLVGKDDVFEVFVTVGGSDEVYRFEVAPNKDYDVASLGINYGRVKKNNEVVAEFREEY